MKMILNHFSRGFFYTIGRIIALAFIGLVLYTLMTKFNVSPTNLLT